MKRGIAHGLIRGVGEHNERGGWCNMRDTCVEGWLVRIVLYGRCSSEAQADRGLEEWSKDSSLLGT